MSALKKRKLNGSALGASAPKVRPAKAAVHAGKPAKPTTKPAAGPVTKPKPAEPESSDEEDNMSEEEVETNNVQNNNHSESEGEEEQETQNGNATTEPTGKKTFADLGVIESLCEACENLGFKHPTPIQEQSIPIALQGRDM